MKLNSTYKKYCLLICCGLLLLVFIAGCGNKAEDARKELGKLNVEYSAEAYLKAIENKDKVVCKLFREAEMDPNAKDQNGYTAVMAAAKTGNLEELKYLIEKNANIKAKNNQGQTAFMLACTAGQTEAVQNLLAKGIELNEQDNLGQTALILAIKENKADIANLLFKQQGIDVNKATGSGITALMYAAQNGNAEIVNSLVNAQADINAKDNDGISVLQYAKKAGKDKVVSLLKDAGAADNKKISGNWATEGNWFTLTLFQDGEQIEGTHFVTTKNATRIDSPGGETSIRGTISGSTATVNWKSGRDHTEGVATIEVISDNQIRWTITQVGPAKYSFHDYMIPKNAVLYRK